mgnify:CR=1 FL=1
MHLLIWHWPHEAMHRIGLTYEAEATNVTSDEIVSKILNKVEVP